jgi:hypothetical protein
VTAVSMTPMSRRVTICIPTTARPHFLRTALQAVQNQIGREAIGEVVVSENKGDRGSEAVVREFRDLPIRYLYREPTLPMMPHLFSTFRQAETPYTAILNDDDWWWSNHLADGLEALEADPAAVGFVAASMFVRDEINNSPRWIDRSVAVWLVAGKPSWLTIWTLDAQPMLALCWVYTPFHSSSLIVRTEDLLAALDQLENEVYYTHTIDRLLFAHLCLRGAFRYNPVPDTFVRWHDDNWISRRPAKAVEAVVRSTAVVVERMAKDQGWDVHEIWKTTLSSMPREVEIEMLGRFYQTFRPEELERLGLASFFHARMPNYRLAALRKIASNAKKLVLGRP